MSESVVKIVSTEDRPKKPIYLRGESLVWTTTFPTSARNLGRQVVSELCTYKDFGDERVLDIARGLADQEPPMQTEISWSFHDGIRDGLEDRRAEYEIATRLTVGEIDV